MSYIQNALADLDYDVELQYFEVPFAEYVTQPGSSFAFLCTFVPQSLLLTLTRAQPDKAAATDLLQNRLRWPQSQHGQWDNDQDRVFWFYLNSL